MYRFSVLPCYYKANKPFSKVQSLNYPLLQGNHAILLWFPEIRIPLIDQGGRPVLTVLELIITAIALAMDAFAVSIGIGACRRSPDLPSALRMGIACGGFQCFMPLIGWALGIRFVRMISSYDHWVAFILIFLIGIKMVLDSFSKEECHTREDPTRGIILISLAVATSIDALAAGVSLAAIEGSILFLAISTGIITAFLSASGIFLGYGLGKNLGKYMEISGGIVLCLIALNILRVHLLI